MNISNKGKLIVIEGLDGSGKGTQADYLEKHLKSKNEKFLRINLPDYDSNASYPVRMYLKGDFGTNPFDVNPYAASTFFAVDRFASFKTSWQTQYENGYTILANRYTTSNIVHHAVKLPKENWIDFCSWLYDFEFNKIGLPKPDKVIYIDMDTDISQNLMNNRYNGDQSKKDIHEKDIEYLKKCRQCALYCADLLDWTVIKAFNNDRPLSREDIFSQIKKHF
ncbi:MAG: thymidylate kinase [Oscillospiraceae bacterium]